MGLDRTRVAAIGLAAVLAASAAPAMAQTEPSPMGPLDPFVLLGPDEDRLWNGAYEDGAYVLTNELDPYAVTYFYLESGNGGPSPTAVSVDVDVEPIGTPDVPVAAGLFVDLDGATEGYYAFVVQSDGQVALFRRDAEGLSQVAATTTPAMVPGGPDTLAVEIEPASLALLVNGESLMTIEPASDAVGAPRLGVIALGQGRFTFAGFALDGGGLLPSFPALSLPPLPSPASPLPGDPAAP
jgi:hypothetical protein